MLSLAARRLQLLPLHNSRSGSQLRLLRSVGSPVAASLRLLSSRHHSRRSLGSDGQQPYDEYQDSDSYSRSRFERRERSGKFLVGGLLGVNGAVFLAWQAAQNLYTNQRDGSWLVFMFRNFTCSPQNWQEGRWWTVATAMFSHRDLMHLAFNGFCIWSFGPVVTAVLGIPRFLAIYGAGGIVGSATSIAYHKYKNWPANALGASAAAIAIVTFWAALAPSAAISLVFIPMKAWTAVGLVAAFDTYNAVSGKRIGGIDSAGHLGGNLVGIASFALMARRGRLR